jgi:hypothetical protein
MIKPNATDQIPYITSRKTSREATQTSITTTITMMMVSKPDDINRISP